MIHSNVPSQVTIGIDKLRRVVITPLPPPDIIYKNIGEFHVWYGGMTCDQCSFQRSGGGSYGEIIDCGFTRPEHLTFYSIRSLIIQLGLYSNFPCKLFIPNSYFDEFGNLIFYEGCITSCKGSVPELNKCNIVSGGATGEINCPGYQFFKENLFASSRYEELFFEFWLRMNADKETSAPIPQVFIGPLQTHRADFTLYLPCENGKWDWYAIEIDSPAYHSDSKKEIERDQFFKEQGYDTIHLKTGIKMMDQVRKLYSNLILE